MIPSEEKIPSRHFVRSAALFGYFGIGNMGDESVVEVLIRKIRALRPDVRLSAISLNPAGTEQAYGIPSIPMRRPPRKQWQADQREWKNTYLKKLNLFLYRLFSVIPAELSFLVRSYRALRKIDLIVVAGSGQFLDIEWGPWNHAFTYYKWSLLAKFSGTKIACMSAGVGPLTTKLGKYFVGAALNRTHYRSFRDENSKLLVESLGVKEPNYVYPDQAFSLSHPSSASDAERQNRRVVGIAPIAYHDPRSWYEWSESVYAEYVQSLASFSLWLLEKGYRIIFFFTQLNEEERTIDDIAAAMKKTSPGFDASAVRTHTVRSYRDVMDAVRQMDVVVASRFHAILHAYLIHVPVLGISYHQKDDDLMAAFGQTDYCVGIAHFDFELLKKRFLLLESRWTEERARIGKHVCEQRARLEEQYERVFVREELE